MDSVVVGLVLSIFLPILDLELIVRVDEVGNLHCHVGEYFVFVLINHCVGSGPISRVREKIAERKRAFRSMSSAGIPNYIHATLCRLTLSMDAKG